MRFFKTALLTAALLFSVQGASADSLPAKQNPLHSTVQYSATATYNSKDMNGTGKIYHAAPAVERREMTMQGHQSIMLINDKTVYVIMPQMNMAMRMTTEHDPIAFATQKSADVKFTKLGSETVNGEKADKYKLEGAAKGTVWVTTDGILVKAEMPVENDVMTYNVTGIKRGAQDKSLFTLPPGTRVMDMNSMKGMMPNMMGGK